MRMTAGRPSMQNSQSCKTMSERILFLSDLDGTLLQPDATLDPDDARRINALTERGAMISYATARTIQSVRHILADIRFTASTPPISLMNGVFIRDMARGAYLDCAAFSRETAEQLLSIFSCRSLHPFVYAVDDAGKLMTYYREIPNSAMKAFMDERVTRYHKPFRRFSDPSEISGTMVYFCLIASMQEVNYAVRLLEDRLRHMEVPDIRFTYYRDHYDEHVWYLEIFDCRASKQHAVDFLRSYTGADRVICFGDNLNDLPMFEASDFRVAVKNANPALIAQADEIAVDGVVTWIETYLKFRNLI